MTRIKKLLFSKSSQSKPINLQNIIKPLCFVSSLLGLMPYSVAFITSRHKFVIIRKSIYLNALCGVTVCMIIFAFLALHIQEVFLASEGSNLTEVILTQMDYVLELIGLIIFCVIAYVCAFINRSKYVKILNQVTSAWYSLPLNNNSKKILSKLQFQVNVVCLGGLLIILILQVCVNGTRNDSLWKIILVFVTFIMPQMIQFVAIAFYYMLVMLVVALMMNVEWHCQRLLQTNMSAVEDFVRLQNREAYTLRKMEDIYIQVFEIKTKINKVYQGPILATALQSFHSMVSEAHIIYHGLMVQKSMTTHEVLNCSFWIMYQILKIYSLAYSGNKLQFEALKIGQILHKIPTEKRDARWLMEIQHFLTLIHHQNIELTVYGYFPLNATLIYNTMASATMYLIILVQFDKRD